MLALSWWLGTLGGSAKGSDDGGGNYEKRRAVMRSPFFMFVNCSQVACKLSVSCFDGVELLCECWVVFEPIIEFFWFNVGIFCSFSYVVGLFVVL